MFYFMYFPESYNRSKKIKVELNLSNYVTKSDLKNVTGTDTSKFATILAKILQINSSFCVK